MDTAGHEFEMSSFIQGCQTRQSACLSMMLMTVHRRGLQACALEPLRRQARACLSFTAGVLVACFHQVVTVSGLLFRSFYEIP